MGRRSFKPMHTRRGSRTSSSSKTLKCPVCHMIIPLNEYTGHIINCREKTSNNNSNSVNTPPTEEIRGE